MLEELRRKSALLNAQLREKYDKAIYDIAIERGVDLGIAFDMLKAVARGANYAEGVDLDIEELKKDYYEIACVSEEIARATGMI